MVILMMFYFISFYHYFSSEIFGPDHPYQERSRNRAYSLVVDTVFYSGWVVVEKESVMVRIFRQTLSNSLSPDDLAVSIFINKPLLSIVKTATDDPW